MQDFKRSRPESLVRAEAVLRGGLTDNESEPLWELRPMGLNVFQRGVPMHEDSLAMRTILRRTGLQGFQDDQAERGSEK